MTMNSQDTREREAHQNKLRTDPEYKANHARAVALARLNKGGDCYPYSPENLAEALREMPDDKILVLSNRLISERTMELGYDLRIAVRNHWTAMAIHLTTKEIENALNS